MKRCVLGPIWGVVLDGSWAAQRLTAQHASSLIMTLILGNDKQWVALFAWLAGSDCCLYGSYCRSLRHEGLFSSCL
jgi:hypothetical protein